MRLPLSSSNASYPNKPFVCNSQNCPSDSSRVEGWPLMLQEFSPKTSKTIVSGLVSLGNDNIFWNASAVSQMRQILALSLATSDRGFAVLKCRGPDKLLVSYALDLLKSQQQRGFGISDESSAMQKDTSGNFVAHFDFLLLICCLYQFGFCVFTNLASLTSHLLLICYSFVVNLLIIPIWLLYFIILASLTISTLCSFPAAFNLALDNQQYDKYNLFLKYNINIQISDYYVIRKSIFQKYQEKQLMSRKLT